MIGGTLRERVGKLVPPRRTHVETRDFYKKTRTRLGRKEWEGGGEKGRLWQLHIDPTHPRGIALHGAISDALHAADGEGWLLCWNRQTRAAKNILFLKKNQTKIIVRNSLFTIGSVETTVNRSTKNNHK